MYIYDSIYTNYNQINALGIDRENTPNYKLSKNKIYSFYDYNIFVNNSFNAVFSNPKSREIISYENIKDQDIRNKYHELLNNHIADFLFEKNRISFSRSYKRFFFLRKETNDRKEKYFSRVYKQQRIKTLVKYYEYGNDKFYRHLAFEINFMNVDNKLILIFNHKYFFTVDGKNPIEPSKITKYTNYLTAREYNSAAINTIFTIISIISNEKETISIDIYGKKFTINSNFRKFENSGFYIKELSHSKSQKKDDNSSTPPQLSLDF